MSTPRQRSSSASSPSAKRNDKVAASPAVSPQTSAPLPATDDRDGWRTHWQAQGQPWRTEPEIDAKRQAELVQRRAIVPDIKKGVYPFKGMKLSRADVEWLLATHENGRGPMDWQEVSQRPGDWRQGLDLRGADLCQVDLRSLPLARIQGSLAYPEWKNATEEQREMATVHLKETICWFAHLEGAGLRQAHLEGADLGGAYLEHSDLLGAHLENARFDEAHLEGVLLVEAHLEGAALFRTHLEDAHLNNAHLQGASIREVYLENTQLNGAVLSDGARIGPELRDTRLENTNLAGVKWSQLSMLGDEGRAREKTQDGKLKSKTVRLEDYEIAARATRQLALALQNQGISEDSARFAYRSQVLQRRILWFQMLQQDMKIHQRLRILCSWTMSWFLFVLAGYGYKPGRSFLAYLLVISGFATAYYILGHTVGPTLSPLGAFVFSMTSFHGRGFFPGNNISLDDPLTVLAAFEALVGLIIEVTFIATLTQRFFNR